MAVGRGRSGSFILRQRPSPPRICLVDDLKPKCVQTLSISDHYTVVPPPHTTSRDQPQLAHRLPKSALGSSDQFRKERLYTERLEKALTPKLEGFRALFQVRSCVVDCFLSLGQACLHSGGRRRCGLFCYCTAVVYSDLQIQPHLVYFIGLRAAVVVESQGRATRLRPPKRKPIAHTCTPAYIYIYTQSLYTHCLLVFRFHFVCPPPPLTRLTPRTTWPSRHPFGGRRRRRRRYRQR